MENSVASRIKQLRLHYNLSVKEFATKCNLSHVAIFHLENGKTLKPHRSSLQRMVMVFGTSADWILYGINDMLPNGTMEIHQLENSKVAFWKEEFVQELKNRNAILEKEVERLWQMVSHFTNTTPPNLKIVMEGH